MPKVLLVGNPNCGKTTLFNLLTANNQRTGNWPGVTVEKKSGFFSNNGEQVEIIDLPGVYSLSIDKNSAQDSKITAAEVVKCDADVIVNVIDACHLERHLYLTTQLLELGVPVIIVLNMMDIAKNRNILLDDKLLALTLHCQVILMQANKKIGLFELQQSIINQHNTQPGFAINYSKEVNLSVDKISSELISKYDINQHLAKYYAYRILEGGDYLGLSYDGINANLDLDILMADKRYSAIHNLVVKVQMRQKTFSDTLTAKVDKIVLNRFLALPIFLVVMYWMFLLAINVGGVLQGFFSDITEIVFVKGAAYLLENAHFWPWSIALIANGVGRGINTTATFIPVIAIMYFLLSMLEASGYMARAAFVIDRFMRFLGLPGKSFVPMIVGFGCNVPGIMAARTLNSERDRILTVLMSPFMSCSARLAIYAAFVSVFFPVGGQNIVCSLYFIGILMAVFTGFLFRKLIFSGKESPFIIELPVYHMPSLWRLLKETSIRLRYFLVRAGKLIIPVCVILSCFDVWSVTTSMGRVSFLAIVAQKITPIFTPLGISQDNWPAVVGLITGTLAKEVVIGSLNSLYAQLGGFSDISNVVDFNFLQEIKNAFYVLLDDFINLTQAISNPFAASANSVNMNESLYGVMHQYFHTKAAAYAYLLFILLYIPCISTMAAIKQEATKRLMWFSIIWSLFLAYIVSVSFYQIATFSQHIYWSCVWFLGILLIFIIGYMWLNIRGRANVIATA